MATNAFPIDAELTAIAIGYRNRDIDLIADLVMPRVGKTGKKFSYTVYNKADAYTVPSTVVARRAEPNTVDFGGVLVPAECIDFGLDDIVPNEEVAAWEAMVRPASGGPVSPLARSTSLVTGLILLDREIRVAGMVFAAATYPATNKVTLVGTSQWSDFTNSNPLAALLDACDAPLVRPNTLVLGHAVWTKLRQHPKIVQAVYGTNQGAGTITREQLAALLEIRRVVVGSGTVNTARKGQAPNFVRVWGKHAALIFASQELADADQPTFGFTAEFGNRIAGQIAEPKMGLRGSTRVRAGESVKEVIAAADTGYFFENAVA